MFTGLHLSDTLESLGKYSQSMESGRQTCWQGLSSLCSWSPCSPECSFWPPWIHGSCLGRSRSWGRWVWGLRSCPQTTPQPPGQGLVQPCRGTSRPGTGPTEGDGKNDKLWGKVYNQHIMRQGLTTLPVIQQWSSGCVWNGHFGWGLTFLGTVITIGSHFLSCSL